MVTVANGSLINYSDGSYSITVEASDPEGNSSSADFTVYVNTNQAGAITVGGISVTSITAVGSSVTGIANLPFLGSVQLTGTLVEGQYNFSLPVSSLNLGGFSLANVTLTLNAAGLQVSGQVDLPAMGDVQLQGSIQDATHFSLASAAHGNIAFGTFVLTDPSITLSQAARATHALRFPASQA